MKDLQAFSIFISIVRVISILIPSITSVLIINFLVGIVHLNIQGMPMVFPIIFCPIGAVLAFVANKYNSNKISLFGIKFNCVLFVFPVVFNVFVTLIFGV